MKTYILTSQLQFDSKTVKKAKQWEKKEHLNYKGDMAHLLFDYLADGNRKEYEILGVTIYEPKK